LLAGTPAQWVYRLPEINATLNTVSAVALLTGYRFIRKGRVTAHRASMLTAFGCSSLFLCGYVYFHAAIGVVRFGGHGWIRAVYFALLTSHTILAVVILPLVLITLYRALSNQFIKHQAIAKWTLPLWLYVSVTGVIVYVMLYRLYPPIFPAGLGPPG
jgi:putative membrane protein